MPAALLFEVQQVAFMHSRRVGVLFESIGKLHLRQHRATACRCHRGEAPDLAVTSLLVRCASRLLSYS